MSKTKKNIIDTIMNIVYKFRMPDEHSVDEDWLSAIIDDARAEAIRKVYAQTKTIDQTWLSDLGLVSFYKVNRADNPTLICPCDIGKTTVPQFITLDSVDGNNDLGIFSLTSSCGKYQYTPRNMYRWANIPAESPLANFKYYWRINTQLYVSNTPDKLRLIGILHAPEDGFIMNSAPIASGDIQPGIEYIVKGGIVIYNGIAYNPNSSFAGGIVPVYSTTNGLVYLKNQVKTYNETYPYPLSADLIRQIELDVLTKEFAITDNQVTDVRNDSVDDKVKNG